MDARLIQAEATYLSPLPPSPALERARALRLAAAEAHQAGLARTVGRTLARLGDALFAPIRRARIREELASLSDRELADIGLTRGEIDRVVAAAEAERDTAPRPAGIAVPRPA